MPFIIAFDAKRVDIESTELIRQIAVGTCEILQMCIDNVGGNKEKARMKEEGRGILGIINETCW